MSPLTLNFSQMEPLAQTTYSTYNLKMQFEALPSFLKKVSKLSLGGRLEELKRELTTQPDKGDVITGTAGARKVRMGAEGRGKSGGFRVIYYLRVNHDTILFLDIYAKNEKDNLSQSEKKTLANLIRGIK
jgi:mRNA-degrading endonuclease RelE of RelBE toxin-antitoxin system